MQLSRLQKEALDNWEGKTVLSLLPSGSVQYQTFKVLGEMEHRAEGYECAMMKLDDMEIPRNDVHGEVLSLVGRILRISFEKPDLSSVNEKEKETVSEQIFCSDSSPDTRSFEDIAKDYFTLSSETDCVALYVNSSGERLTLSRDKDMSYSGEVIPFKYRGVYVAGVSPLEWDEVMSGDIDMPDSWGGKPVQVIERVVADGEEPASEV